MFFNVNGVEYKAGKLNAFKQLYVSKRLTKLLPAIAALAGIDENHLVINKNAQGTITNVQLADDFDLPELFGTISNAISSLPDEDLEFIFNTFLEVTERKQVGGWAYVRRDGVTMFELDLPELMQIGFQVFKVNLANFTASLPSLSALFMKVKTLAQA